VTGMNGGVAVTGRLCDYCGASCTKSGDDCRELSMDMSREDLEAATGIPVGCIQAVDYYSDTVGGNCETDLSMDADMTEMNGGEVVDARFCDFCGAACEAKEGVPCGPPGSKPTPSLDPACTETCDPFPNSCDTFIAAAGAGGCMTGCGEDDFTTIVTSMFVAGQVDDECLERLGAMSGGDDDDDDTPECTDECTAYPVDCDEVKEMTMTGCASSCNMEELLGVAEMVIGAGIADQDCIDDIMAEKMEESSSSTSTSSTESEVSSPATTVSGAIALVLALALAL